MLPVNGTIPRAVCQESFVAIGAFAVAESKLPSKRKAVDCSPTDSFTLTAFADLPSN
jgi:hypothetical protein